MNFRAQTVDGCALDGSTVLVIDDGEANVLLLQRLLSRAGAAHVEGLTDPRHAVERLQSLSPDIVLLDMHMPWMDGLEVLAALQSAIPAGALVPIVVLTADTTIEARHRALAAGAKDFITKPFEQTEVLLRIQNLLETRALHLAVEKQKRHLEADLRRRTEVEQKAMAERQERVTRIDAVLFAQALNMVYQPIVHLKTGRTQGVEALARFTVEPRRSPDEWFTEAATVGRGADLEMLAIRMALSEIGSLPATSYLSVNVDPQTIVDERLEACIGHHGPRVDRAHRGRGVRPPGSSVGAVEIGRSARRSG